MYTKTLFISKNYTGLIKKITKDIYNSGINIEKSQMIVTKENILILNTFTPYQNQDIMNSISNKYNEENIKSLIDINKINANRYKKLITMNTYDNTGIIHDTSNILSDNDIDIINLNTDSKLAPFTSSKVFNMDIVIDIPTRINNDKITELLTPIIDKYNPELIINDV